MRPRKGEQALGHPTALREVGTGSGGEPHSTGEGRTAREGPEEDSPRWGTTAPGRGGAHGAAQRGTGPREGCPRCQRRTAGLRRSGRYPGGGDTPGRAPRGTGEKESAGPGGPRGTGEGGRGAPHGTGGKRPRDKPRYGRGGGGGRGGQRRQGVEGGGERPLAGLVEGGGVGGRG